jgi:hypothetical protein
MYIKMDNNMDNSKIRHNIIVQGATVLATTLSSAKHRTVLAVKLSVIIHRNAQHLELTPEMAMVSQEKNTRAGIVV